MPISNLTTSVDLQKQKIANYAFAIRLSEQGQVVSVGDGIIWIKGLATAAIDEILISGDGNCIAMVFHLTENLIGAIMLLQNAQLKAGTPMYHYKRSLSIPVGDKLLGRVVDPLGHPLDAAEAPECDAQGMLDILSPPITKRDFVNRPLYTGNKIIDTMIPLGKGQRQLIIGDNGLGKSSLVIDIILNQKDKNVRCVYVIIGQKRSTITNIIQTLNEAKALEYTTIVVAEATALPGLLYLAPFAGCAIAENWMQKGFDTLVVYDDLSAHANSYRELSLLLRRPPGREAFPADIFYLHSRLLERSTCLSAEMGGGSMTALPIIETKEGEIATYIPTNLISITDGQIFFDEKLFSSGFFPAIDITKSVSRVGGNAQVPQIKREAGRMKLDYMQFLELEIFTRFGAKLDSKMQNQIQNGRILRELLKQDRLSPLPTKFQMAWLIAYNDGMFKGIDLAGIPAVAYKLEQQLQNSNLSLSSERDEWSSVLRSWLNNLSL